MSTGDRNTIDRGYGFQMEFELQRADATPETVSNTTAVWKLAASNTATEALITRIGLTASTVGGRTIVAVTLSEADTESLPAGQYYHQLAVSLNGAPARIYLRGFLTVEDRL